MYYGQLFVEAPLPKPFSEPQLNEYFKKMASGDFMAREEIIKHNIRYAINEAKKYFTNSAYSNDELVSVGLIGLIKSVDTFDLERGHFIPYCRTCINNEILMFLRLNRKHTQVQSLNCDIVNEDGVRTSREDIIFNNQVDPIEQFLTMYNWQNVKQVVQDLLLDLSDYDREVIELFFGFDGAPCSQVEIARRFHVDQSCISRRISRILRVLQRELVNRGINEADQQPLESQTLVLKSQGNRNL